MTELTETERQHLSSLNALQESSHLVIHSHLQGDLTHSLDTLPPPEEFNPDWQGLEFDASIRGCAMRFGQFGTHWTSRPPSPPTRGGFGIFNFYDVLTQDPGPVEKMAETTFGQKFLSELRCIDQVPQSDASGMAFLRFQAGRRPLEIWYSDITDIKVDEYPSGYVRMETSYCEYLDALLLTKGAFGWQYLYTDTPLHRASFNDVRTNLTNMLSLFPRIFPEHDYSNLRERLADRS